MRFRIAARLLMGAGLVLQALCAQAQTLHVVTEHNAHAYLQDGRVAGRATEVVEQTLQRAGLRDYRIDIYPWARALDLAQREPNVLIYLLVRTPAREAQYRWVGEIMRGRYFFYALPGRTDLNIQKLDDARPLSIGVVRDDVRQQFLQQRGFQRLAVSAQPLENIRKLLYRQVDLVALTEIEARRLCDEARPECTELTRLMPIDELPLSLYMAYSRSTSDEVVQRSTAAFEALRTDGSLARIMGAPSPAPTGITR